MTIATLVLLAVVVVGGAVLSLRGTRARTPIGAGLLVGLLAVAAYLAWRAGPPAEELASAGAVVAVLAAVLGGGPVTIAVLLVADPFAVSHPGRLGPSDPEVLRGGTVIGILERIAVAGTLLAKQFEVLAVILALKTAARATELKAPVAAERFLIGTLVSVLWTVACVGVAVLLRT